jgi:hypothetical protein
MAVVAALVGSANPLNSRNNDTPMGHFLVRAARQGAVAAINECAGFAAKRVPVGPGETVSRLSFGPNYD